LSEEEQESLKTFRNFGSKTKYSVQLEAMDSQAAPFIITQPEFMRRMKEMSQSAVAECSEWQYAEMYNLV